jgi:DNA-binding NtrC family response regulator
MSRRAFRQDLYLGIKGFTIEVPPLRHRKDDLPILIHHFASTFAEDCGKRPPHFSDEVIHVFQSYDWPGNLKELRILIRRLVLSLEEDQLQVKLPDLPPSLRFRFSTMTDWCNARTLEELEAEHIHKVLNSVDGNKSRAAEILGINRKTLWDKLKRYSLND